MIDVRRKILFLVGADGNGDRLPHRKMLSQLYGVRQRYTLFHMRPRTLKTVLVAVGFIVVCCLVAVSLGDHLLYSERPFNRELWQRGDLRQRARMVHDLRYATAMIGRTRSEVLELLGPPDRESSIDLQYDFINGSLPGDILGLPFSDWTEWLSIEFDAEGRVSRLAVQD